MWLPTAYGMHACPCCMQYDYSGLILNVASLIRRPAPTPSDPKDPAFKVRAWAATQPYVCTAKCAMLTS